ncbi:MAG: hypothetical protein AB1489_43520 [Acidobacteriota bacterium]
MKIFIYLVFVIITISLSSFPIYAQQQQDTNKDVARESRELDYAGGKASTSDELTSTLAEMSKRNKTNDRYKNEINRLIIELNGFSKQLLELTLLASAHDFKKIAKLANKIAKSTKELRQQLNIREPAAGINPEVKSYDLAQLSEQARIIDDLINRIRESNITRVVDVSSTEQTRKGLEEIESKALSIKLTARGKS